MANTSPDNISYPTNASAKKTIEGHIQDTATSVQTALDTKASLSGATFTGDVTLNGTTSTSDTRIINVQSLGYAGIRLNGDTSNNNITEPGGAFVSLGRDASSNAVVLSSIQNAGYGGLETNGLVTGTVANSGLLYSSSVLHLGTAGAVRMTVDGSGRVSMPNQPAFYATRGSAGSATSASNVIIYNTDFVNVGSCYNTSNGRFTAPVAGNYCFTVTSIGNTSGTTRIYQRLNGANINGGMHLRAINTANYGDASITWMWPMSAGDYFDNLIGEGVDYGGYYSSFSGFLVG